MSKTVITLVGASLFLNYQENHDDITHEYRTINKRWDCEWKTFSRDCDTIRENVTKWASKTFRHNASAEITSILQILETKKEDLTVCLLASDTIVSHLAAEIVRNLLQGHQNAAGHRVTVRFDETHDVIQGLQVTNEATFQEQGMLKLVERIKQIAKEHDQKILLNITGGFKATIPYLTLMGNLYSMPLCYVFEDTDTLLDIPTLPIQFDWSLAETYYPYLKDFGLFPIDPEVSEELLAYQLLRVDRKGFSLTVLGDLYLEFIEKNLPCTKSIFGHMVEYKLLEYYSTYPYHPRYAAVKRGVKWPRPNDIEMDLVLGDEQGDFIEVESKSFLLLQGGPATMQKQIQRHLRAFEAVGKMPREYHLCIYYYPPYTQANVEFILRPSLQVLQMEFQQVPCTFKPFFLSIEPTRKTGKLSYQKFIDEPIQEGAVKPYH